VSEALQALAGGADRRGVAIAADQAGAGLGREQRLGVTALAQGGVEVEARPVAEELEHLGDQDRLMTRAHGPAPAHGTPGPAGRRPRTPRAGAPRSPTAGTGRAGSATDRT